MKKNLLTILFLGLATICNAQSTTKYFNNEYLEKEVAQEKAKYSQTVIQNTDGLITTEIKNIKKGIVIRSETYKDNEPFGIWIYQAGSGISTLDYNFNLKYSEEKCKDSISEVNLSDPFQDVDSVNYKAPKIASGEKSIYQFIGMHFRYPARAREEGIQGKVYVALTITADGNIDNIIINRGTNILLDKEAVRVLRLLKFSNPPTLNGQNKSICVTMPVSMQLR